MEIRARPVDGTARRKTDASRTGSPGTEESHRPLVPRERVNQVEHVLLPECEHFGAVLSSKLEQAKTIGDRQRHQVIELPDIQLHITEHQCHCLVCEKCGKSTRARLPKEVKGNFGPRLTALIA